MFKTYEYRIYPNKHQQILINKHFGCNRFIYNWGLNQKLKTYETENRKLSCFDLNKMITQLKKQEEYNWLSEVHSQSLQQSMASLDDAFTRFFKKQNGFPKFKKKSRKESYQISQYIKVDFDSGRIHIPKIKSVKCIFHRKFDGKIKTCTIKRSNTNKYFVCILVDINFNSPKKPEINKSSSIGIDLGITHFATFSNGEKLKNPRYLEKYKKQMKFHQRKLSKMEKKSNNFEKQVFKINKIHEKISNKRKDFLHKVSYILSHENQVNTICVEDLSVSSLLQSEDHNQSRRISDVSWNKFLEFLKYKCDWYGKNFLELNRFDPSSKICNHCGHYKSDLTLQIREWRCPDCNSVLDRDINAAINIRNFCIQKQNKIGQGLSDSKLVETGSLEPSVKQEASLL